MYFYASSSVVTFALQRDKFVLLWKCSLNFQDLVEKLKIADQDKARLEGDKHQLKTKLDDVSKDLDETLSQHQVNI